MSMTQREVHMAAENWSQPIFKTFEQIVYFSTSVTGHRTKKSGQK